MIQTSLDTVTFAPALSLEERKNLPPVFRNCGSLGLLDRIGSRSARACCPLPQRPIFAFGCGAAGFVAPLRSVSGRERVKAKEHF